MSIAWVLYLWNEQDVEHRVEDAWMQVALKWDQYGSHYPAWRVESKRYGTRYLACPEIPLVRY